MRRNTGIRIHAQLWDDLQTLADATAGRFSRNQLAEHAIAEYVERERRKKPRGQERPAPPPFRGEPGEVEPHLRSNGQ